MNNEKSKPKERSSLKGSPLFIINYSLFIKNTWGCSSVGRAPALQAGGQEFDSPHLHQGL